MCGIVGILGNEPVALNIVEALRRLEYRGYDSAGVATIENGAIERRRAPGKLRNLEELLRGSPLQRSQWHWPHPLGHPWCANEANAHPHISGDVVIVHNGIIENFYEIKVELEAKGVKFETQTDTEVVAHLLAQERKGRCSCGSSQKRVGPLAWCIRLGHHVQIRK